MNILICLTRFVGIGVGWGGYWVTLFLPFITVETYFVGEWKIKFVNDWKL